MSEGTGEVSGTVAEAPAVRRSSLWARLMVVVRSSGAAKVGLALVLIHVLVAILAPLLTPYQPIGNHPEQALAGVSAEHWAGTDQYGRDVLTRVLFGGRYALVVSALATVCAVGVGTVLGCLSALASRWFDTVLMRVLDAVLAVPAILALLVVVTALGTGIWVIVLAVTVTFAPQVTRVMRAAAQNVVPLDYVSAARARGEGWWSLLWRELLPNVVDVIAVEVALRASWVVLLISSLSFLGFGADPPTPDWGLMVSENRAAITVVPMATIAPIIALATLVIGLNLASDGLSKGFGVDRAKQGG